MQNPESAGTALRTISLRLRGTKEGKEELEREGQDIDGYIESVSKLRDTIKNATVTSKSPLGIDILDKNGQYKSTFLILKEIATVWQDILETDKKMGSNHAALTLETLGGKRGSQAVASILDNPKMLEAAYERALDSEGVAQQELDAQLNSIDGHLKEMTNRAQEFWTTFINSDTIKGVVDLGTAFLNLGTGASKFFDALPGSGDLNVLSALIGGILSFKGAGGDKTLSLYRIYAGDIRPL